MELTLKIIIHFLDYIMIFNVSNNVIRKDIKWSYKNSLIGVIYAIIPGMVKFYTHEYIYKIFVTFAAFLVIYLITNRKLHDLLIIYIMNFLLVSFAQLLSLFVITTLNIVGMYWVLLAQLSTCIIVLLICKYFKLYVIYEFVNREIIVKLFVYMIALILFGVMVYFDFDYNNAETYISYLVLLVIISILGLYRTIKYVLYYTNEVPVKLHDVKNVLIALQFSAQDNDSVEDMKAEIKSAASIIGIEIDSSDVNGSDLNYKIKQFIEKKGADKKYSNFVVNVNCDGCHLTLSEVLYFLATLLDNAIESGTQKDIIITVSSDEYSTFIRVSNEYVGESRPDFERMFQKGYSTKESQSSGYGLSHLTDVLKKHKGELLVEYTYNKDYKCEYLTITIIIKKRSFSSFV